MVALNSPPKRRRLPTTPGIYHVIWFFCAKNSLEIKVTSCWVELFALFLPQNWYCLGTKSTNHRTLLPVKMVVYTVKPLSGSPALHPGVPWLQKFQSAWMMNDGDDGDDGQISRARGCWFFHSCGSPGFFDLRSQNLGGGRRL